MFSEGPVTLAVHNPLLESAYLSRGLARETEGNVDGALADYKEVLEINPSNPAAHHNLGRILYLRKDLDAALREMDKAMDLAPRRQNSTSIGARSSRRGEY